MTSPRCAAAARARRATLSAIRTCDRFALEAAATSPPMTSPNRSNRSSKKVGLAPAIAIIAVAGLEWLLPLLSAMTAPTQHKAPAASADPSAAVKPGELPSPPQAPTGADAQDCDDLPHPPLYVGNDLFASCDQLTGAIAARHRATGKPKRDVCVAAVARTRRAACYSELGDPRACYWRQGRGRRSVWVAKATASAARSWKTRPRPLTPVRWPSAGPRPRSRSRRPCTKSAAAPARAARPAGPPSGPDQLQGARRPPVVLTTTAGCSGIVAPVLARGTSTSWNEPNPALPKSHSESFPGSSITE